MKSVLIYAMLVLVLSVITIPSQTITSSLRDEREVIQADDTVVAFSPNILLSTDDTLYPHHVEVTMALDDNGKIFVGWKNAETHNGGGAAVSWVLSTDNGNTWTNPVNMANFGGGNTRQSDPWMVWSNGVLYYAYLEFGTNSDFSQITVAGTNNDGRTWSMACASFGNYFADKETMFVSPNGTIYVVYDDVDTSESGNVTVKLSKSVNGGRMFFDMGNISDKPKEGHVGPYIAVDEEEMLYVAWSYFVNEEGNILFDKSYNGGVTFGKDRFVNVEGNYSRFVIVDGRPSRVTLPVLRFDNTGRLYLLWADTYPNSEVFDVYLRYSDNKGLSWSRRFRINNSTNGNQWNPEMAIDSAGNLHIAYYSEEGAYYRPVYRMVSFVGENRSIPVFGTEIPIASKRTSDVFSRPGEYFGIQVDSGNRVHVAWADGRNNEMDVFYAYGMTTLSNNITTTIPINNTTLEPKVFMLLPIMAVSGVIILMFVIVIYRYRKRCGV